MILLPVLTRELLVSARKKSTYLARVIASGITIAMALWLMLFSNSAIGPAQQGKFFLLLFTWFAFIYCLFAGIDSTADCISSEKREGTLGLLFLTDLRPFDVLAGKIAATSLHHLYTLLAVVPMLALCLLMGGVTGREVFYLALVLLNTLFFSISAGALVSTFSVDQRKAMFASGFICALAVFFPFLLETMYYGDPDLINPATPVFLQLSAAYPFIALIDPAPIRDRSYLLLSVAVIHCASWFMLLLAASALPGRMHDSAKIKLSPWETWKRRLLFGTADQRQLYRRRLLDQNAYFWLTAQERLKAGYSWLIFAAYLVIYLIVWFFIKELATDSPVPILMALFFHFLYKCWVTSEVSYRLVEDRRVGAFELLLSTSITPREINTGLNRALLRQFGKPILATLFLDCMAFYILFTITPDTDLRKYTFIILVIIQATFFIDLFSLKWLAAWNSLFSSKQGRVLSRISLQVLVMPWILLVITGFILMFAEKIFSPRSGYIHFESLAWLWVVYSLLLSIVPALHARSRFLTELRTIAANRFDTAPQGGVLSALYARFFQRKQSRKQPFWVQHWALTGCVILIIAVLVGLEIRQRKWEKVLNQRISKVRSQNLPTNSRELAAYLPYVPQNQNGALFLDQAAFVSPAVKLSPGLSYRNGLLSEPMPLDQNLPEIIRTNLVVLERQNRTALQLVSAITNYPKASFESNWIHPWSSYDRRMIGTRNLVAALEANALLEMDRGNLNSAALRIHQLLIIYSHTSKFAAFQMQHFRRELTVKIAHLLERLINKDFPVNSAEMIQIESLLSSLDNFDPVKNSLLQSQAFAIEICTNSTPLMITTLFPMQRGVESAVYSLALSLEKLSGTHHKKLASYLDRMERALQMCEMTNYSEQLNLATTLDTKSDAERAGGIYTSPVVFFSPHFAWLLNEQQGQIARFRLMRALIYAERMRVEGSRSWTNTAQFPPDPFTGKQLVLRTNAEGFTILSVGQDMREDSSSEVKRPNQRNAGADIQITRLIRRENNNQPPP